MHRLQNILRANWNCQRVRLGNMDKYIRVIVIIETIMLVVICFFTLVTNFLKPSDAAWHTEYSPNGKYYLDIHENMKLKWPRGEDVYFVMLHETNGSYRSPMYVRVYNDGKKADYEIDWKEGYVQVVFRGSKQTDMRYILPYSRLVGTSNEEK